MSLMIAVMRSAVCALLRGTRDISLGVFDASHLVCMACSLADCVWRCGIAAATSATSDARLARGCTAKSSAVGDLRAGAEFRVFWGSKNCEWLTGKLDLRHPAPRMRCERACVYMYVPRAAAAPPRTAAAARVHVRAWPPPSRRHCDAGRPGCDAARWDDGGPLSTHTPAASGGLGAAAEAQKANCHAAVACP